MCPGPSRVQSLQAEIVILAFETRDACRHLVDLGPVVETAKHVARVVARLFGDPRAQELLVGRAEERGQVGRQRINRQDVDEARGQKGLADELAKAHVLEGIAETVMPPTTSLDTARTRPR